MTDSPWWRNAVVYQIYPRSFADSNGDGIGDLPGITSRLDYLAGLGVDVVWLSPVYVSPQDDAGYDISDYTDIDPMFGTLADFDRLVAAIHRRGMKLVMDLVVNHTSDEHSWFADSRSSRDNPKRDWYWWRPAREGMQAGQPGAEPNNWRAAFGGPAWQFDEATGEYYLHLFSRKQPDLNWESPAVRHAVYAMMAWWADRGVDGFRMDVINFISKDPSLPDLVPGERPAFICGPRIHEFLQEMHRDVFAGRDTMLTVGEMPGVTVEQARLFTDPVRAEVDMVFQFEHVGLDHGPGGKWDPEPLDLRALKASFRRWQDGLAQVGWNSLYWDNHDQPRIVSRWGEDSTQYRVASASALATVLHLHRGTPYVYQGEEIGMTNADLRTVDDLRDVESRNHYAIAVAAGAEPAATMASIRSLARDNARTPMQWDGSANAGFTSGDPWMPTNANHATINVAASIADTNSVYHHYRKLIELRHRLPVVAVGDFTMLLAEHPHIYAFTRQLDGVTLLIVANLSGEPLAADVSAAGEWADAQLLLGNLGNEQQPSAAGIALRPWEARVYRR